MKRLKTALYRWISHRYMAGCSNYNPLSVRQASRSKEQAREMFAQHGFPHARGTIFLNPLTALRFADAHGYPLVVKPNVSGFSRGSYFPINNRTQLIKATLAAKLWWPTTVVEQYLRGANYRVLATGDEIVSVIRRYPPFVDGNGEDTISVLIDKENAMREQMRLYPTIHPIEKSTAVTAYLNEQGLTLNSVPAADQRIELFHRIALAPGGVVETIDPASIPAANQALFQSVVRAFDATLFGIDVICEHGIEHDYRNQRCIFLEVNSRPYTRMHNFPRYGAPQNLDAFHQRMDALAVPDTDTF